MSCSANSEARDFSVRDYLAKHYGVTREHAVAAMAKERAKGDGNELDKGIRLLSHASYVGDKIAQTEGWEEKEENCLDCYPAEGEE